MIYALNPTVIIRWIALLTLGIAVGTVWLSSPGAAHALWSLKSYVLAVPSAIVFSLTLRPVFRVAHRLSLAKAWLFPMLDGQWEGEVHSNWPRIKAMMEAARGDGPTFNALSDPTPTDPVAAPVPITARIESGLLDFRITLTMSPTRRSHTIFVKPERRPTGRPRLYYVYRQEESGTVEVSDASQHQGAAYLDYDSETDSLSGAYWTERQGELGLNTAGRIRLWRRSAERARLTN